MKELSMLFAFLTAALAGNAVGNAMYDKIEANWMYDQLNTTECKVN